jgi:hypothetical protein
MEAISMTDPSVASRPKKFDHLDTIQYEIDMTEYCYSQLVKGYWPDKPSYYLSIEGFLIHYRNLCEFFGNSGDLKANEPEVWNQRKKLADDEILSIQNPALHKKYTGQISQYLAHCTKSRADRDRTWNILEMYAEVEPVVQAFRKFFPVQRLPSASIEGSVSMNASTSTLSRKVLEG